ncbi:MAG: alpha/beta hydrolase [Rickettsiaceae bacterium]
MPEVFFNGPAGRIEAKYAESANPKAPIALVLHPHPQFGGTMNNKVVYNVYKTLYNRGFTVLRINFRGVGKSLGEYDNGIGEMMDASAALDWLQNNNPMSKINLIAGFSFGAWIAMQLIMRRPELTHFLAISPPVNKYDFTFLSPCPAPGLIIQGDKDTVVSEESVHELAQRLMKQKNIDVSYKLITGADHFFRNKIDLLNEEIEDYLHNTLLNEITQTSRQHSGDITAKTSKKIFLD